MKYTGWKIISDEFENGNRQSKDALFTVGNGYFGIRGFFEENGEAAVGNGGIYVAGIVGKGFHKSYTGKSRELCNIANIFRVRLSVNGNGINGTEVSDFSRTLDMKNAVYSRRYIWNNSVALEFSRFADMADVHRVGQKIVVKSLTDNNKIDLYALIDTDVVNLNKVSCEPLPIQPGRDHITERKIGANSVETVLDDEDCTRLYAAQKVMAFINGKPVGGVAYADSRATGMRYGIVLARDDELVIKKVAAVYTSKYEPDAKEETAAFLRTDIDYDAVFADSCAEWEKRWNAANVEIKTDTDDDTAVRYNLFELMCACPVHTDKVSIGARGLTGEMYEGCVFWDTEIFQLPFFIYSDPAAARRLLTFRYNTLEQARRYARELRMEAGAQYPWQVSEKGIEQTESSAGFFSVHLMADIAYAIKNYVNASGDDEFLVSMGAEMLIEIARFWEKRSIHSDFDGYYHIMTVRGPNEYSPIVDDNAFTNYMAAQNLLYAVAVADMLESDHPQEYKKLAERIGFCRSEIKKWKDIADNLYVGYDEKKHLVAEYPTYFNRYPFDIKKYKPTAKRILESGTPYDFLYFYQITKQADTVLLMCLLPDLFSDEEKKAAYEYYEPRTVHDSSLSYAPHAWLASRILKTEEAYAYFKQCAYLDINDMKLNAVSGIHFANFGGTWMSLVFGFCGISFENGVLKIDPKLPEKWESVKLNLTCRGENIHIEVSKKGVKAFSLSKDSKFKILCEGNE